MTISKLLKANSKFVLSQSLVFLLLILHIQSNLFINKNLKPIEGSVIYSLKNGCKSCFTDETTSYSFRECTSEWNPYQRFTIKMGPDRMTYRIINLQTERILGTLLTSALRIIPANSSGVYILLPEESKCLYNGFYTNTINTISPGNYIFQNINDEMLKICKSLAGNLEEENLVFYLNTLQVLPKEEYNLQLTIKKSVKTNGLTTYIYLMMK